MNILRLLQSIDEDKDTSNGISIPQSAHDNITSPEVSFTDSVDIDVVIGTALLQTYGAEREIVTSAIAVDHFINTLSEFAEDELTSLWDLHNLYLVERDKPFDGSFISIRNDEFEFRLGNQDSSGTVSVRYGVYQMQLEDETRFLTPGTDEDGNKLVCLGNRPYRVTECRNTGRLFAAFSEESAAIAFSEAQLNTGPDDPPVVASAEEDNTPGTGLLPLPQEPEPTTGAATVSVTVQTPDSTPEPAPEQTPGPTPEPIPEPTAGPEPEQMPVPPVPQIPAPEPQAPTEQENEPVTTLETSTDCPTNALTAPATFSVAAVEPSGCQWEPLSNPPWTWSAQAQYDRESNTVTDLTGGIHLGMFERVCKDTTSGTLIKVTASCKVTVDSPAGFEAITDLFFLTGQANAASPETHYDQVLDANDPKVFAFTDNGWQVADLHQFWDQDLPGNYSMGTTGRKPYNNIMFQVAKALVAKTDRIVGIVMLTAPGEGISHWDYNSEFYLQLRNKALDALNSIPNKRSFDALLWMQGESDWVLEGSADPGATGFTDPQGDFYRNYYPNKLFQLISNLRSEVWFGPDGKFVCTETRKAALNPHLMALNSDKDPLTGCAAASDLDTRDSDPFGNHFAADSLRILGRRVADVYLELP